jgi:hypothetical protein
MTDLVDRLRAYAGTEGWSIFDEAAAALASLQEQLRLANIDAANNEAEANSLRKLAMSRCACEFPRGLPEHQPCAPTIECKYHGGLRESSRLFGEIMAVMHGDGGHYLGEHGPQKAFDDALTRWCNTLVEIDRLRERVAELEATQRNFGTMMHEQMNLLDAARAESDRSWETVLDWEKWAAEVLTDFRMPFDNHKVGLRLAIVELIHDFRADRDAARAEAEALRKDAERYRWLRDTPTLGHGICIIVPAVSGLERLVPPDVADAIIDQAREGT